MSIVLDTNKITGCFFSNVTYFSINNFANIGHTALKIAPCERARLELLYLGDLVSVEN